MSGKLKNKIIDLQERFMAEQGPSDRDGQINDILPSATIQSPSIVPMSSPVNRRPRQLDMGTPTRSRRQLDLPVHQIPPKPHDIEVETKIREIMKMNGMLTINGKKYLTEMKDLIHMGELGNGTCGHVVKMLHKPSNTKIAVKQMRRSGNTDENKRIIMDLDVVLKSHDCPYIVQCLGCFITESDVWICMELMATCLDKLLKKSVQPMPEAFLGKVTVATVKALSYLKDKHGVIHRDVKPSNILLDSYGGVKLCDFGISGRLVDSKAKTRSAGCAAYMAPERIDPPDPTKPAYDIRADVWSLGITLVELATGVFPYRDCKTDFEVLSRVVEEDPPVLPSDVKFSKDFRSFVASCLTKNYKQRPKYTKLMEHSFIKLYENDYPEENILMTDSYQWFNSVMQDVNPSYRLMNNGKDIQPDVKSILPFKKNDVSTLKIESISPKKLEETILSLKKIETISLPQKNTGHISLKQTVHQRSHSETPNFVNKESQNSSPLFNQRVTNIDNGSGTNAYPYSPYTFKRKEFTTRPFSPTTSKETVTDHETRPSYTPYRQYIDQNRCATNGQTSYKNDSPNNLAQSRPYSPYLGRYDERDKSTDRWQNESRSLSPFKRDYSPWRRENVDPPGVIQPTIETSKYSPFIQHRKFSSSTQNHPQSHDIYGSPMISRKRFPSEPPPPLPPSSTSHGSTSPQLLISRFAHQQKLDATTTTTNSTVQTNSKESAKKRFASYVRLRLGGDRAPSPEPPPRLSRGESPLALRRNVPEQTASPSFPRRYVSPSPPQPPPRRLSESSSVPGSPQYARSRLHYTLEQQGRPPPP